MEQKLVLITSLAKSMIHFREYVTEKEWMLKFTPSINYILALSLDGDEGYVLDTVAEDLKVESKRHGVPLEMISALLIEAGGHLYKYVLDNEVTPEHIQFILFGTNLVAIVDSD